MNYKFYKLVTSLALCAIFLFLSVKSFAQADDFKSLDQELNFIDKAAVKTYCSLNKIFNKSCDKATQDTPQPVVNLNITQNAITSTTTIITNTANNTSNIKNNTNNTSNTSTSSPNRIVQAVADMQYINKRLIDQDKKIEDIKNRPASTIIRNIQVLQNKNNDEELLEEDDYEGLKQFGLYNTVVGEGSRAFGDYNTITVEGVGSYVLGTNIVNLSAGSVEIGTNNKGKLHIGADGFVGIGSSAGPATSRIADEQLRVSGRVRAGGFDVDSAADVAENFPADESGITAGNIIEFSTTTHKWQGYDISGVVRGRTQSKIIGVVATNPGLLLGSNVKGVPVAFSGRVPVKVTEENGRVMKGDRITLSDVYVGVGAKLIKEGQSVGVALSSDNGSGSVLLLVKSEYVTEAELNLTR